MSVFRGIERSIEGLIEGVFGRAFRAPVQAVELARKLAREMDDHRSVSVSKVYAANEFTLYLAPADREQFAAYEASLVTELQQHLAEHARRERYQLLSPPLVMLATDAALAVGEFGIATSMVEREPLRTVTDEAAASAGGPQPTTILCAADVAADDNGGTGATLTVAGRRVAIPGGRAVVGRSAECDVPVEDVNVSRRHCEVVCGRKGWEVVDLGSTNGTEVNGRRVGRAPLADGDTITVGSSELVFGCGAQ